MHERYGIPGAIVAHAWFDTPTPRRSIAAQAAFPLVRGIRSKPVTAPSPDQDDCPARPARCRTSSWLRGFALSKNTGCHGICGFRSGISYEAAAVARAFPKTKIILNHTAFRGTAARRG